MYFATLVATRCISTSSRLCGKKNFRKFLIPNKRGTRQEKLQRGKPGGLPIDHLGIRPTGTEIDGKFRQIPEWIPQLIVPDLTDCKLKPYVSYRSPEVTQSEFTSQDLFNAVYAEKIIKDYQEGKLDAQGEPLEPSENEKLTPTEAVIQARKTGSDFV